MRIFPSLTPNLRDLPVIAVDVGYSSRRKTCGVASTTSSISVVHQFGPAVELVAELCRPVGDSVLVLEAVLSTFHNQRGNPENRGNFEKGRGWYYGPGAVTMIAAQRFLQQLGPKLGQNRVWLAEAFLSNDPTRTHKGDAALIAKYFWSQSVVEAQLLLEPASAFISGVPPIRVFRHDA